LSTTVSQGSVATCLRCGGILVIPLLQNLLPSPLELRKSVNIWQRYGQEQYRFVFVFDSRGTFLKVERSSSQQHQPQRQQHCDWCPECGSQW